ncbi:MAG: hypothetical protein ACRCUE_00940 [Bosea sp. (in: a-proteobacteria)]
MSDMEIGDGVTKEITGMFDENRQGLAQAVDQLLAEPNIDRAEVEEIASELEGHSLV